MLLEMGDKNRTRQRNGTQSVASLVSLSLLFDFSINFFETGQTMRGFHRSYRAKCLFKYGMKEEDIVSWYIWRQACNIFWKDIFTESALRPIQSISRNVRMSVRLFVFLFVRHTLETTLPEGLETSGRRAYR